VAYGRDERIGTGADAPCDTPARRLRASYPDGLRGLRPASLADPRSTDACPVSPASPDPRWSPEMRISVTSTEQRSTERGIVAPASPIGTTEMRSVRRGPTAGEMRGVSVTFVDGPTSREMRNASVASQRDAALVSPAVRGCAEMRDDPASPAHSGERDGACVAARPLLRGGGGRGATVLLMTALLGGCGILGGGRNTESPAAVAQRAEADARIRGEVEGRLAAEPALAGSTFRVEVERGEVRLHGVARGAGALRCAARNAELTPGVSLVIDFAELAPGPGEARCLAPRVFRGARAAVRDLPPPPR
jgi:hypothetical protein